MIMKLFLLIFLYIGAASAALNSQEFYQILAEFEDIYAPMVAEQGGQLELIDKWDNDKVEAWASQDGNNWRIEIYGGVARAELIDRDALLLVLCHEMGHHLGGAPRTHIRPLFDKVGYWLSVEGQADYFATAKCIKRFVSDRERVVMASYNMLTTVANKYGEEGPALDKKDDFIVSHTIYKGYPSFQCRFDTMVAGFDCYISHEIPFDNKDVTAGACLHDASSWEAVNARPLCWYRPD